MIKIVVTLTEILCKSDKKNINFQPIATQLCHLHLRVDLLKDEEYFLSLKT